MKMKLTKYDIGIVVILIAIVVGIVAISIYTITHRTRDVEVDEVKDYSLYFMVVNNINTFYEYVSNNDNDAVISLLDNKYIEKENITRNNLNTHILNYGIDIGVIPDYITTFKIDNNIAYFVHGKLEQTIYLEPSKIVNNNFNMLMLIDIDNLTFSLYPTTEEEYKQILSTIEEDLSKWQKASNGQAKMPPVIDFSSVKAEWFERGAAGGYSEADFNGSLAFSPISKKNQSEEFREILRHEMAHTNDLKFNDETIKFDEVLQSCNYAEELKNAGLSDFYINYAGTDKREFIAVAAQGDMSKYSAEFKETLINLGMPEWLFNV